MSDISQITSSAHIIVMGNEKGGSGKSTTAMHLAIALLRDGWRVGTIDLDGAQATLTRYVENRLRCCQRYNIALVTPEHFSIVQADGISVVDNQEEEFEAFQSGMEQLEASCEIIIIDTPGSETHLMRMAHMMAGTLITPINDSFLDLDVIGTIHEETGNFLKSGSYACMVGNCQERQINRHGEAFDWIIMRNRLSNLQANNKIFMSDTLIILSAKLGFKVLEGLHERVVFRELFPAGLTVLDDEIQSAGTKISMSHIAARQEIRNLVDALNLPQGSKWVKSLIRSGSKARRKETVVSSLF